MAALPTICATDDLELFNDLDGESALDLIEVFSDDTGPRRNKVTSHFTQNYIENDFQVRIEEL